MGLCTSRFTTMRLLSQFRVHADKDLMAMITNIEVCYRIIRASFNAGIFLFTLKNEDTVSEIS